MKNLDLLDKKILYELDINARQPITRLAKKIGKSRNVIEYRIKRLQEKGIIKNFITFLDAGKLGLTIWNVYVEFQNMTSETEKEIVKYLEKDKKVWWIALPTGRWNLIYSILVKNIKEFYSTVRDFNSKYGHYILNQSLAAHVEVEIFSRGYFLEKPAIGITWYKKFDPVKLSDIDIKILKEISTNARLSSVDLANKLNLTARIVSYRIKDLVKKGIITRFRLHLDVSKFGYGYYKIVVHVRNMSKENDKKLMEYCKQLGNVIHYEKKIGPWMLEIEIDSESYEQVNETMKLMKEKFPEYIKSYEIMLINNEPKGELDLIHYMGV